MLDYGAKRDGTPCRSLFEEREMQEDEDTAVGAALRVLESLGVDYLLRRFPDGYGIRLFLRQGQQELPPNPSLRLLLVQAVTLAMSEE